MSRRLRILLGVIVALALLIAAGPRPDNTLRLVTPELPPDLETWLKAREAGVADLRPGDARRIDWADPATRARTPLSIVYLHGFSASPQEVSPLAEDLARTLKANLYFARMPGHGRFAPEAMGEADFSSWINEGLEALAIGRQIGTHVLVIGTSTGGTLAHWLAASGKVIPPDAVVEISPNFGPRDARAEMLLWPWFARIAPPILGKWYAWQPANAEQERHWNTRYPALAAVPMMQLVAAARSLSLSNYRVPTLIFRSRRDQVVNPDQTDKLFARMVPGNGIFELVDVTKADDRHQHVLAGRILSPGNTPATELRILDFVRRVIPPASN